MSPKPQPTHSKRCTAGTTRRPAASPLSGLRRAHGVSLVEALVALAVMAFGMLALVGVQSTMRMNSDLSKQRSEATRIATEELERLRNFVQMTANPALSDWDDIVSQTTSPYVPPGGIGNTSYDVVRTVMPLNGDVPQKLVRVAVTWTDRTGTVQTINMESAIARSQPVLAGLLSVQALESAFHRNKGRNPGIPPEATDVGGGKSGYKPFDRGTVVWIFDDITGVITDRCTGVSVAQAQVDQTTVDPSTCPDVSNALSVRGEVNFNLRFAPKDLTGDAAVLKPIDGDVIAWKFSRSARSIVEWCTVPAGTATAALVDADVAAGPNCHAVGPRGVLPYQTGCTTATCTDTGSLTADDSDQPRWPALNLSIVQSVSHYQAAAPDCVHDAPGSASAALARPSTERTVRYFCVVYPQDASGWGGRFDVQPQGFSDGNGVPWSAQAGGQYKVCRYTHDVPSADDASAEFTLNDDHPKTYCIEKSGVASPCNGKRVTTNLRFQNFLVISASQSCPTDGAINASTGDVTNSNTRQHQP